ncbi:MAG: PAS domain-containing sensor histidine kinase [Bacteroidales bacterium]
MKTYKLLIIKPFVFLWISILFLILGILLSWPVIFKIPPIRKAIIFEKELSDRYLKLQKSTDKFIALSFNKNSFSGFTNYQSLSKWEEEEIAFLVYENNKLVFWSDNSTSFPAINNTAFIKNQLIKTSNGWYQVFSRKLSGNFRVVTLGLLKHDYPYENNYLKNTFHSHFSASEKDNISFDPIGYPIKDIAGKNILYYNPTVSENLPENLVPAVYLCIIISFLSAFLFVYYLFGKISIYREKPGLLLAAFIGDIILFRFLSFWFGFPELIYKSELFSPAYFAASSFLPSLGDLLTNVILLFFISIFLFRYLWNLSNKGITGFRKIIYSIIIILLLIVFFACYISSYKIIIFNSSVSLNLSDPSNLTTPVISILIALTLLTGSFFLLSLPFIKFLTRILKNSPVKIISSLIFLILLLLFFLIHQNFSVLIPLAAFMLFAASAYYILYKKINLFSFSSLLLQIIIFSTFSTYMVLIMDQSREIGQRKLLAQKIATETDPLAEYLVKEAYTKMQSDTYLINLLAQYPEKDVNEKTAIQYITDRYFGNYWTKYNLEITLCTYDRILNVVIPDNALMNCRDYFSQLVKAIGKPTLSENMYFLDYGSGSIAYLAILPFNVPLNGNISEITVYVDITSKRIPKGLGYPELLISKESKINPILNNYSYAIYKKEELIRSFGKYSYPLNQASQFNNLTASFKEFNTNNYSHLVFHSEQDKIVVVSLKKYGFIDNIAPFSYFSILLSILAIIGILSLSPRGSLVMKNQAFRNRLQLAMSILIIFSFIITGIISAYYIIRLNQSKNTDILTEKAHSILIEIQQKLGKSDKLTSDMNNEIFYLLNKFSLIFFSDINLYDLEGNLVASSRPLIFEEGLLSTKMNCESYAELSINQKSLYIHEEKIGNYNYLSAYLPFRNEQDKLIGYLNLPYFARQDELRSELSAFLVTFINIYVLLVAVSILVAILISRYITKPMLLIRDKISQVKLGKPNEKIEWRGKDEIAGLIEEYNIMIDKLSDSAEQLARSERESAWREMARQVAHEIKNPLTPMKLSVQLLLKAYNENEPDWDQRLRRFSQTLIEQIDNLSHISSSFSDFARMPELKRDQINLTEVCNSVIELHGDNLEVTIIKDFPTDIHPVIYADSNQIMRILMNLFKNSIQAITPGKQGIIELKLRSVEDFYELVFSDNGTGIEKNQQHRIFSPNFTTKTGGMGLGLAMVKSIMEDHGGSISFISVPGEGTTFFLRFPAA